MKQINRYRFIFWAATILSVALFPACVRDTSQSALTTAPHILTQTNSIAPSAVTIPTKTPTPRYQFEDPSLNTPQTTKPTATSTTVSTASHSSPTVTSTPVATLMSHVWQPQSVLVFASSQGGDGCCPIPLPPNFVLYADGRLFVSDWVQANGDWRMQILTQQLSSAQTCRILNTIDQIGFFDYDPASYNLDLNFSPFDGVPFYHIRVYAWRAKSVSLYGLGSAIRDTESNITLPTFPPYPTILPALRDTYHLLFDYPTDNMSVYQPERLGLWIDWRFKGSRGTPWPLEQPSLAELYSEAGSDSIPPQSVVLRGTSATTIYELYDDAIDWDGLTITDGQYSYHMLARPLLPYEAPPGPSQYYSDIPSSIFPTPSFSLNCQPSDGTLEPPFDNQQ